MSDDEKRYPTWSYNEHGELIVGPPYEKRPKPDDKESSE